MQKSHSKTLYTRLPLRSLCPEPKRSGARAKYNGGTHLLIASHSREIQSVPALQTTARAMYRYVRSSTSEVVTTHPRRWYAALGHRRIALRSALSAAAPTATRLPATGLRGSRSTACPAIMNAENNFPRVHRRPVARKHIAASNQSLAADGRATEGAACLAPAPGRYVFHAPHRFPMRLPQTLLNSLGIPMRPQAPPEPTLTSESNTRSLPSCGMGRPKRRPPAHASPAADHPLRPSVLPAVCCGSDRLHHAALPWRPPPTSAASRRLRGSHCRASSGAGHQTVRCSDAPDGDVTARISRHKRVLGSRGERAHWGVVAEQRRRRLRQKARRRDARAPAADQLHSR